MEQPQDTGQQPGAWGGCASMSPPQQGPHEQQAPPPQQQPSAQVRTPTHGSKAFKIVNPHTNEEVKGKDGRNIVPGEVPVTSGTCDHWDPPVTTESASASSRGHAITLESGQHTSVPEVQQTAVQWMSQPPQFAAPPVAATPQSSGGGL